MIRHSRLTALGILLCLLAALFSLEAKIAWFNPAGSASAQISYDKASPAEPLKAFPQGFTAPAPPAHDVAGTTALIAAALFLTVTAVFAVTPAPTRPPLSISPGFSSSLFYRPPPAL